MKLISETAPAGITREIHLSAAYDKRSPDPSKNYGIHGCEWQFIVRRNGNAIVWQIMSTDWYLPHVRKELEAKSLRKDLPDGLGDVGYHSKIKFYEEQPSNEHCYATNGPCYYNGACLQSNELFDKAVADPAIIWPELEKWLVELEQHQQQELADIRNFS